MEGCEYIVERVIDRRCETLCYRGHLALCGLSPGLCPPLSLCSAQVAGIRPCGTEGELEMTVFFTVRDARGCPGEGTACLRLCLREHVAPRCPGDSLRRGAEVTIAEASFAPPCGFFVCLNIELRTLVGRCEVTCCPPCACASCTRPSCPPLPLYPPPPQPCRLPCLPPHRHKI